MTKALKNGRLLITVRDAAAMACISESLARRYSRDGTWPVVRIGAKQRGVRVVVEGLRRWIDDHTEGG